VNSLEATDAFYEVVAVEMAPRLAAEPPDPLSHWMILSDANGLVVCRLDDVSGGASAAAFLTARQGFVLAQVLIAEPRNSDLRRASLAYVGGELQLGPWAPQL